MLRHVRIKDDLHLINQTIEHKKQTVKETVLNTHHIFIIDCSGSMDSALPEIRKDLHNKISTLLKVDDSFSLLWFSGQGEQGVILENYRVNSSTTLEKVRELINRHLTSRCLTAFKGPLEEAKKIIARVNGERKNMLHSLFFLTDGNDNCNSQEQIIKAVTALKDDVSSATIVEYGWYCNKELMNKMAKELGGVHKFSKDFQDYEPAMEKQFNQEHKQKRTYMPLEHQSDFDAIFNIIDGEIISYLEEKGEVLLNSGTDNIFYFSKKAPKNSTEIKFSHKNEKLQGDETMLSSLYASLFVFSRNSDYNKVSDVLGLLGDAYFIIQKSNTFGTQKINELEAKFLEATVNSNKRYSKGYNPNLEPKEDAFCVMDMLDELMSDEDNLWYPKHEAFEYERIGRKAVTSTKMNDEDVKKVSELLTSNDVKGAKAKLEEIEQMQNKPLQFHFNDTTQGYSIMELVWNNSRANLSVMVNYLGYVELPDNTFKLPKQFKTNIFRNYTLIKDGVIHTYKLPVSLSKHTFHTLQSHDLLKGETYKSGHIYVLDFSELPVVNRLMIKSMSAKELFTNQYELTKLQANNTVFNHYKKSMFANLSTDFMEVYGEKATEWLKELGITAGGFSPKKTLEKAEEEIEVNVLEVKIDKLTVPNTKKDFEKILLKLDKKEVLTSREELLVPAINEFKSFQKLNEGIKDNKIVEKWLSEKSKIFRKNKSKLMNDISKVKFLTIVGKAWFNDLKTRNDTEMTLKLDGKDIKFTVEDKLEKIKI